jgi:hypothetical protein
MSKRTATEMAVAILRKAKRGADSNARGILDAAIAHLVNSARVVALPVDVAWISEYGLTQKLSNSIRVF